MKDVLKENHTTTSAENVVDWLKRVEIAYMAIVHIVEEIRKYDITDTNYIRYFDLYYRGAKDMLGLLFGDDHVPTEETKKYHVELDSTFSKYLADEKHWKQAQVKINETLMMATEQLADFGIPTSREIEKGYIERLVVPVNTLLAKYHKEHGKADDIIYRLTYDNMSNLYLNDVLIYHAKLGGTDDVLNALFEQDGPVKQVVLNQASVNTVSIINNIKIPKDLRGFMMKSSHKGKGIKMIAEVKRSDIARYNINTAEVDEWLKSKAKN